MRLLLLIMGLLAGISLRAQVYVVPNGAGDGSSWGNAMGNIEEALKKGGAEVRVAVGIYELEKELVIPAGKTLSGGWIAGTQTLDEEPAAKTILRATQLCRVATVEGKIKGFTIERGVVKAGNGGGLYVTSTGVAENCIVRGNVAGPYYPQVGDAYCIDGTFLRKEEITAENVIRIEGMVFWVNPDPNAKAGQRGWVCALDWTGYSWAGIGTPPENITEQIYVTVEEALADTAGYTHTQKIVEKGTRETYPAAYACHDNGWYLPALGQMKLLLTEMVFLEATYTEIRKYTGFPVENYFEEVRYITSSECYDEATGYSVVWGVDFWGGIMYVPKQYTGQGVISVKSF